MHLTSKALSRGLFCVLATIALSGTAHAQTVRLGSASFSPTTIGAQGQTSVLSIGIETSISVPSNATATVEVTESSNFGGVAYTVSGGISLPRRQTVMLSGGGNSTTATFTFRTTPENTHGGTIVSRVTLVNATEATTTAPLEIPNLNLIVNPPSTGSFCNPSPHLLSWCSDWDWQIC